MNQAIAQDDFLEQKIRGLVEELRRHVDMVTAAGDEGTEVLGRLGARVLPRLWALVLGDPPPEYTPGEDESFADGGANDTGLACIEVRRVIRSLEFWMSRTYRPWGCLDLEQFAYRLESLLKEREPDPALFARAQTPTELAEQEHDARWFTRTAREHPGRPDERTARMIEIVRQNPGGLTTAEIAHLVNAEESDADNPKLMS
jgi:hypothetical protein